MTTRDKLIAKCGQVTRYELALCHKDDGRRFLVAYQHNRSRRSLADTYRERLESIEAITGAVEFNWAQRAAGGIFSDAWVIKFTQRTQRDAIAQGELPFIMDHVLDAMPAA